VFARGSYQAHDVVAHRIVYVHTQMMGARVEISMPSTTRVSDSIGWVRRRLTSICPLQRGSVAQVHFQHEAIELSFRQRKCAFVFDGILSGQHDERPG